MTPSLTQATALEAELVPVVLNPEAGHANDVAPPPFLFDTSSAPVRVLIDKLRLPSRHDSCDEEEPSSSTIRLAHAATGRLKEVTIVPGNVRHCGRVIENGVEVYSVAELTDLIQSQIVDLPDITPEVCDELPSSNPRLCEAVLRSVFAPRGPGESLEDCMKSADVVKQAFTLQANVYAKAETRALKVAQYRRAELQLKLESLQKDDDALVPPTQFHDPVVYQSWKMEELQILSNLVDLFGNLPSFSGGVQVKILSVEGLKLEATPKCVAPMFKKKVVESRVYCSVTILPARPGNMPSPVESEEGTVERTPAYFSEVVNCIGDAEWNSQSPWIPICSLQDRILIEVWEKSENVVKCEESEPQPAPQPQPEVVIESNKLENIRGIFKRRSTSRRKKVAPWSGDIFLGQVIVSFSHIESQALAHGGVQGQSPATSYMLADERGKQGNSTLQLQFTCSCERFYREAPPNKLLLMPPVEEIESAFDNFVRLAFHAEDEALFQLGPQWRQIVYGFGAHYRIRGERCALGMVNVMVGLFQEDARYCIGIVPEWLPVCSAAKEGTLTKNELALHCHIVVSLMKPLVNALENFQTLFPGNKPKGAISRLVELLGLLLRLEPDFDHILIPLKSFIQNSCKKRLYKHLFKDTADRELKELTAQSLLKAVQLVRSDLVELSTTYTGAFPDGFNLPHVTGLMYYKLVCHYISTYMKESSPSILTKEHEEMLNEFILLRGDVRKLGLQVQDFGIESLFSDRLEHWIGSLAPRLTDRVDSIIGRETWEPLSTMPSISSSVNGLSRDMGEGHGKGPENSSSLCGFLRATYIQLNNISAILEEQKKLKSGLYAKWQSAATSNEINEEFAKLEDLIQQVLTELIGAVLENTQAQFKDRVLRESVGEFQGGTGTNEQQSLVCGLDHDVNVMRTSLYNGLSQRILRDLPAALLWCMEGLALNLDDDHKPITEVQCRHLGKVHDVLNNHFNAPQHTTYFFPKEGSARLHRILVCRTMEPQHLSDIYSQAWKTYQQSMEPGNTISPRNGKEVNHANNGHRVKIQNKSPSKPLVTLHGSSIEGTKVEPQLHVLDYLSIIGCKSDRKSRELVVSHSASGKAKYLQAELNLGKEKTLATYSCRLSRIIPGLFYITTKRVCFVKFPGVPSEKWSSSFLTFDKIQRIEDADSDALVFVPIYGQYIRVGRISNRNAALAIIHQQIAGSGSILEKNMALISRSHRRAAANKNHCPGA
ncbi:uncharacterized protein [Physcomitrium patens]|uniref:uncharacterized protein isoform X3 n=1 Tax=Physcomitrium patens TaxID=3218 RepID=UPI000D15F186|nr:uncharacterized protein LOC112286964 isoform X3 [Physcomitrium patens]|eukprot:XP_024385238.1 uncharacterized protein LOC112286964 isoform X3 [Physcomitrella patens]